MKEFSKIEINISIEMSIVHGKTFIYKYTILYYIVLSVMYSGMPILKPVEYITRKHLIYDEHVGYRKTRKNT